MRVRRRVTAGILLVLVVGLGPMAHASPIDPSFPGGFYDNGDFDDVVRHLTSRVSVVEAAPLRVVSVVVNVVGTIGLARPQPVAPAPLDPAAARPPPVV